MVNNGLSLVTTCSIVATVEMPVCSMAISGTDWLEVATIYFWPIFQAYAREYPHKIWPEIWYSTSIESDPEIPIDPILTKKHPQTMVD